MAIQNSIIIRWHPDLLGRLCEQIEKPSNPEEQTKEFGGLLLGTVQRDGGRVEIIVRLYTPISCSYQDGPLYHLTPADKSSLQESIVRCVSPYWSCIGFYRSHSRPGLEVDEEDLRLAREHLNDPPSIFLLLAADDQPSGGFFMFDGREFSREPVLIRSNSPPVGPGANAPKLPMIPSREMSLSPASDYGGLVVRELAGFVGQLQALAEPVRRRASAELSELVAGLAERRIPGWLACTLILLALGFISLWSRGERDTPTSNYVVENSKPFRSSVGLMTSAELDHVRVAWNPRAASLSGASHGTLLVSDGPARHAISLDEDALAHGSVVYYPTSDVATFKLWIGGVTDSLVAAGLDRVVRARSSVPERADVSEQQVTPPHENTRKDAKATVAAAAPTHNLATTRPLLSQRKSPPLPKESGSKQVRLKYQPPPRVRPPVPVPVVLQPPDPRIAANATPAIASRLPATIALPPPPPQPSRSEPTAAVPNEHVDFVAAKTIKHVSPQASGNALRLLVTSVTIHVQVHINPQGRVVRADSLSHGGTLIEYLSGLSVNAAREWVFAPARREGRDVDSDAVLEFIFDNKGIESPP